MEETKNTSIRISVRDLVEFIMRSGDIDTRSGNASANAMQEGSRLHRKFQKSKAAGYRAEVSLKIDVPVEYDSESFSISVEGRADGIFEDFGDSPEQALAALTGESVQTQISFIDEIKTIFGDVMKLEGPVPVHRSQAVCYAYIYAVQNGKDKMGIQMTYVRQETEEVRTFREVLSLAELTDFFGKLIKEYAKWAAWEKRWIRARNESVKTVPFPFDYREGQKSLVGDVYRTILRKKKLFIEAPTGVGKTISTVFPATRAMGEGLAEKIFYGTAKTIARTVAEEAFGLLIEKGMRLKVITITSKEKVCILDKPQCNPLACERAKGHFDRVNDAVYDMLTNEDQVTRETVLSYAEKHMVCPFEMCLDVATWSDAVICDYNYIFDPTAHLKRFFDSISGHEYILLLDEAHNLVERAREMFSAELVKEDFLAAAAVLRSADKVPGSPHHDRHDRELACRTIVNSLNACNKVLLNMKRETDEFELWEDCDRFLLSLLRFVGSFEDYSKYLTAEENDAIRDLYFEARHFIAMSEEADGNYTIYSDYPATGRFRLRLQCMDPSPNLKGVLEKCRSSVFFSATLLPVNYYKEQLGGNEEDYAVYAPSPFDSSKRLILVAGDVSTKYTRRGDSEYEKIASYIECFTLAKQGNYLVFFPSYRMMEDITAILTQRGLPLIVQSQTMTEELKEEFLGSFTDTPDKTLVGCCVMGGIFSEGIDLKNDRLIGAVVVGTGLPMVCNERELFRGYFDEKNGMGFEYAYLYNGMNKVLQAGGRVIRTTEDVGAVLLLDERFLNTQYRRLFPREWNEFVRVSTDTVSDRIHEFWEKRK